MKNKIIHIFTLVVLLSSATAVAQIKANQPYSGSTITDSSAFLDASPTSAVNGVSVGKGMIFPRANLTTLILANQGTLYNAGNNPNRFDGMLVYNSGTGTTVSGQGITTQVKPGFYYFNNPTAAAPSTTVGQWFAVQAGSALLSGASVPNSTQGANGDFYINTITNDIYGPKTAGAWGAPRSLVGATGPQGAVGPIGLTGPAGSNATVTAGNGLTATAGNIKLGGALTEPTSIAQGANTLAFTSNATNGFSVDGSTFSVDALNNRIGVGVTNPMGAMQVNTNLNGGNINSGFMIRGGDFEAGYASMWMQGVGFAQQLYISAKNNGATGNFQSDISSFANSNIILNKDGGNIGIGTTTPTQRLDVNGGAKVSALAGTGSRTVVADANGVLSTIATTTGTVTAVTGTAPISVATGTTTPVISLNDSGITTIKVADANITAAKLTAGAGTAGRVATADAAGVVSYTVPTVINTLYSANGSLASNRTVNKNNFQLEFGGNGNTIFNGGNVGIGTSTPSNLLTVNSNSVATSFLSTGNAVVSTFNSGLASSRIGFGNSATTDSFSASIGTIGKDLVLYSANAVRMTISDANGNVGIGTTAPIYKLDVVGRSRFQAPAGDTAGFWLTNEARTLDRAFIGMQSDDNVGVFGSSGGNFGLLMNVNNLNVGINAQPAAAATVKLNIGGAIAFNGAAGTAGQVLISNGGATNTWVNPSAIAANNIYNTDGALTASRTVTQAGNNLTFTGAGNLIKIGAPFSHGDFADGDKLLLLGTTNAAKIGHTAGYTVANFSGSNDPGNLSGANTGDFSWSSTNTANNGWTERMRIKGNGNIGIGTAAPTSKLEVFTGANYITAMTNDGNGSGGEFGYNLKIGANEIGRIAGLYQDSGFGGTGGIVFSTRQTGTVIERMRILGNGNVGIGTAAPATSLDINGAIAFNGAAGTAGQVLISNGGATNTWVNPSAIAANNIYNADGLLTGNRQVNFGSRRLVFNGPGTTAFTTSVGIGTTTPTKILDVAGAAVIGGQSVNTNDTKLIIRNNVATTSWALSAGVNNVNENTFGIYKTTSLANGVGPSFSIDEFGSVGIGTGAPTATLDVVGFAKIRSLSYTPDSNDIVTADTFGTLGRTKSSRLLHDAITINVGDINDSTSPPALAAFGQSRLTFSPRTDGGGRTVFNITLPAIYNSVNYAVTANFEVATGNLSEAAAESMMVSVRAPIITDRTTSGFRVICSESSITEQNVRINIVVNAYDN